MSNTFEFSIPANLKFGVDVVNRLGNLVSEFGEKAVIVTEGILHESGIIKRLIEIMEKKGCQTIVFDEVIPNAGSKIVDLGVDLARSSYADVIIGLGGVRALSIAKAIAMLTANKGTINDYLDGSMQTSDSLPYIEIPSTPRNPFMFRDEFWITDSRNNSSKIIKIRKGTTKYILFDPMITTTLRPRFTASTIIDSFANSIEGYISTKANFLSDTIFLKSLDLFNKNIFNAVNTPDDIFSRANLSLGGLFSSIGLNMSSTGITAALSYVLSSKFKIHKSFASSVLLPHVMDFNITAVPTKIVKVAESLGEDTSNLSVVEASIKAIEKIRRIIIELKLPVRLEEFELAKDDLIIIADEARKLEMFNYIPRSCSSEELYAILQASY
jgi:alcohol dehydrogenase class IV